MNKLNQEKQAQVIQALVEGCSIRSTSRMTGVAKGTILKLLADVGKACEKFHNENVKGIYAQRVQCDEIWAFCYAKDKNLPAQYRTTEGMGSVWTFTAIEADSKLCINWKVGHRDVETALAFMKDLKSRCKARIQLTTDAWQKFYNAVFYSFGQNVDYAMLQKEYLGQDPKIPGGRYSPPTVTGLKKTIINGKPNEDYISTSFVERQNLNMRMSMRRFTRLTNAFSKKYENLKFSIALHFFYYNFCRIHQSLRTTPAMEAGLTNRVWEIKDLLLLIENQKYLVA